MENKLIGVYGAGGCGRGILPIVRASHLGSKFVYIDDGSKDLTINGQEVLSWDVFTKIPDRNKYVSIAVSAPKLRSRLFAKCLAHKIQLIEVRAPSVVEFDCVELGEGSCLSPFVTIASNVSIGVCFHANIYSYVEHDCVIGNFVTLGPAAKVNGNVNIGDYAYIGSGAVIRQGLNIGSGAVVGMGAVVTRDVSPGATVIGNPAKPLVRP